MLRFWPLECTYLDFGAILLTLRSRQGIMLELSTCKRWTFITLTRELMNTTL